jgi:hypothetical protein
MPTALIVLPAVFAIADWMSRAFEHAQPRQISRRPDRPVGFLQRSANFLSRSHCWADFLFGCHEFTTGRGPSSMSIDTLLVILILTFGVGAVLHRWDLRRHL